MERKHPADALHEKQSGIDQLANAAHQCRECDLYRHATQVVFGEGPERHVMLVGEQPGDQEDRDGRPFVGPAGRLLDRALEAAGIDRDAVYLTNAVKHFKWRRSTRGKRRIHDKPDRVEAVACRPWLDAEIATIGPRLVVGLGATACQSMLGPQVRVTRDRGEV